MERKLGELKTKFIGGEKISIGDFVVFSIYADFVYNEHGKNKSLREALQTKVGETPKVSAWVEVMQEENKEHLANRHVATI